LGEGKSSLLLQPRSGLNSYGVQGGGISSFYPELRLRLARGYSYFPLAGNAKAHSACTFITMCDNARMKWWPNKFNSNKMPKNNSIYFPQTYMKNLIFPTVSD